MSEIQKEKKYPDDYNETELRNKIREYSEELEILSSQRITAQNFADVSKIFQINSLIQIGENRLKQIADERIEKLTADNLKASQYGLGIAALTLGVACLSIWFSIITFNSTARSGAYENERFEELIKTVRDVRNIIELEIEK